MCLNRREWWFALAGSIAVLTSCATARRSPSVRTAALEVSDNQLAEELALLAGRPYSEIGIPMLLFGENLEVKAKSRHQAASRSTPSSVVTSELREAFERLAVALSRIRTNPSPDDVASLLEWMAERDFGQGLASSGRKS